MAPSTTAKILRCGFSLILLLNIVQAVSNQYSGVINKLYSQAVHENRPLVLVLDNADNTVTSNNNRNYNKHNHNNNHNYNSNHKFRNQHSETARHDHSESRVDLMDILQAALKKSARPSGSSYHNHQYHAETKNKLRTFDDFIKIGNDDSFRNKNKMLRSSVIKNLLRYSKDLNCEANNECKDSCDYGNKKQKNACSNECDQKFDECQDDKEDVCGNSGDDCNSDEDKNISTRGEILVTEKPTCNRC